MKLFSVPRTALHVELMLRDEHCPPHVHVDDQTSLWEARFAFSFVSDNVILMDVDPIEEAPNTRTIDRIKAAIAANLAKCRAVWWEKIGTCCLDRRWMRVANDTVTILPKRERGSIQIHTARYSPAANHAVTLILQDGTTLTLQAGQGTDS